MDRSPGIATAACAFTLWGILPFFWKQLEHMPPLTIVCHRTLWGLPLLLLVLGFRKRWNVAYSAFRQPGVLAWHALSGTLLAGNWLLYIWATLNDRILEGALGYYLNPFFNMLFGFLWFGERHNQTQIIAIAIAFVGVACQFPAMEGWPWVALALASSFSIYAVIRKRAPLGSLEGLTVETSLMVPLAAIWLLLQRQGRLPSEDPATSILLLLGTGAATVLPLVLFGHAARKISLTALGILQFIGPSLQFLIGWIFYQEPMPPLRFLSFGLIWIAISMYAADSIKRSKRTPG